jgi:hypothetical protein
MCGKNALIQDMATLGLQRVRNECDALMYEAQKTGMDEQILSPQPDPCPVSRTLVEPRGDWTPADRVPHSEDMESLLRQNGYYPSPTEWLRQAPAPPLTFGRSWITRAPPPPPPREELPNAAGAVPTAKKAGQHYYSQTAGRMYPSYEHSPEYMRRQAEERRIWFALHATADCPPCWGKQWVPSHGYTRDGSHGSSEGLGASSTASSDDGGFFIIINADAGTDTKDNRTQN